MTALTRYTFWKDNFRYFIRDGHGQGFDSRWDTDGGTGNFMFPPTDGLLRWRLPFCLEVIPGKEAGDLDVDVAWLDREPEGIYERDTVASACDIDTPSGAVVLADHFDDPIATQHYGDVRRCRILVEAHDRDVSAHPGVPWGARTSERHLITVWPTDTLSNRWTSTRRDDVAQRMLDAYRSIGIDPDIGRRDP